MARIVPIQYTDHLTGVEKRFIINDIVCVGFSIINENVLSVLFALHQDLFDHYQYMNINLELKEPKELEKFKASGMYIKDIQKDQENGLKLKDLTKYLKPNNLYTSDLNFDYDEEKNFYIAKGIRATGKNISEIQEYQIGFSEYIQFMLFLQFISQSTMNSSMFLDDSLKNVRVLHATSCKLDGTVIVDTINKTRSGKTIQRVISHYTIHGGPTKMRVNYSYSTTSFPKNVVLREPMIYKQYDAEFGKDPYVTCCIPVLKKDQILVVVIDRKKKSSDVIRMDKELYQYTNFISTENYIFCGNEETEESETPHVKF